MVDELQNKQLTEIICAAGEIYKHKNKPVKILDLATGPNGFNPFIVKDLIKKNIDYEFVLSDISPLIFEIGYENMKKEYLSKLCNMGIW